MFREATMAEIAEILRLWLAGTPRKRTAAWVRAGPPKAVRWYVAVASETGLRRGAATACA